MSKQNTNNIIDINVQGLNKKRYRINGDDNLILELNPSDLNILPRLKEIYPKLIKKAEEMTNLIGANEPNGNFETLADNFKKIDDEMREMFDYIFDTNVSEICAPNGSMYDPVDGKFRFEHIIDTLIPLFTETITHEMETITNNVNKHTSKYVKK